MKIQKLHFAPVQPKFLPKLTRLVNDPTHNIAWTPDVSHLIPFTPTGTHPVMPGVTLQTANLPGGGSDPAGEQQKKIRDISLTITTKTGALLKEVFPKLEGPVGGIEFFVATARAAGAWTDPKRTTLINPAFKTAQAVLSGLNALQSYMPKLAGVSPQLKIIGMLVSLGDVVYQLYTIWPDDDSDKPDGGAEKKP